MPGIRSKVRFLALLVAVLSLVALIWIRASRTDSTRHPGNSQVGPKTGGDSGHPTGSHSGSQPRVEPWYPEDEDDPPGSGEGDRNAASAKYAFNSWMCNYQLTLWYPEPLDQALVEMLRDCHSARESLDRLTALTSKTEFEPFLGHLYVMMARYYAALGSLDQCEAFIRMAAARESETSFAPDIEARMTFSCSFGGGSGIISRAHEPQYAAMALTEKYKAVAPELVSEYALQHLADIYLAKNQEARYEELLEELWRRQRHAERYGEADMSHLRGRLETDPWASLSSVSYYFRTEDLAGLRLINRYLHEKSDPAKALPYQEGLLKKYSSLPVPDLQLLQQLGDSYLALGRRDDAVRVARQGLDATRALHKLEMDGAEARKEDLARKFAELIRRASE